MNCPACGRPVVTGEERCGACDALLRPAVDGALAPEPEPTPRRLRQREETLRDIPALKKRETAWKDEVVERVRFRRRQRGVAIDEPPPARRERPPVAKEASPPLVTGTAPPSSEARREDAAVDLPLRMEGDERGEWEGPVSAAGALAEDWAIGLPAAERESRAVERPARASERVGAAAIDSALLLVFGGATLYLASRIAHATLGRLAPAWLPLSLFLACLGLGYATFFTGTTGQTLGKILGGMRVVDRTGHPPRYLRAFARAVVAVLGIVLFGVGLLPILFDPARRAFHDRLLKTRVVKG